MKKQYSKVIKIVIQILFFLWIPESFAASLYAVKKLIHAVSVMDFTYAAGTGSSAAGNCCNNSGFRTVLLRIYL